jgi:hypothetical protein
MPDVVFVVFTLAVLGALFPVFNDAFLSSSDVLSLGESYLFQLVLPFAVLVVLATIWRKAIAGVDR